MAKPNSKETNIRSYYTEVNKFGQNGEYDKAIKSLNKSNLMLYIYISSNHLIAYVVFNLVFIW